MWRQVYQQQLLRARALREQQEQMQVEQVHLGQLMLLALADLRALVWQVPLLLATLCSLLLQQKQVLNSEQVLMEQLHQLQQMLLAELGV